MATPSRMFSNRERYLDSLVRSWRSMLSLGDVADDGDQHAFAIYISRL